MLAACSVTFLSCGEKKISSVSIALPAENSIVYVNDEFDMEVSLSPNGASAKSLNWTTSNSMVASVDNGKVKAQRTGSVTITATSKDDSSIKDSVTFEIYQRNEGFALGTTRVNYTGTTPIINIVSPANLNQDSITFAWARKGTDYNFSNNLPIEVGEYVIKASITGQSGFCFADLSILPAPATVSIGTYEKAYLNDFNVEDITIQKNGFLGNDANLLNSTFLIDGETITSETVKGLSVGQHPITINQLSTTNPSSTNLKNYDITVTNGTLNVVKRDVIVQAENSEMFYKQWSNPAIGFSILDGEEQNVINDFSAYKADFTGSLTWEGGSFNVGEYAIGQGTLASDSFNIKSFVSATFKIKAQPVTISPLSVEVQYGTAFNKNDIRYTISGLREDDVVSNIFELVGIINTSSSNITKSADITITNNGQDVTSNYDITVVAGATVTYNTGRIELIIPSIERDANTYSDIASLIPNASDIVVKVNGDIPETSPLTYTAGQYVITWDGIGYALNIITGNPLEREKPQSVFEEYEITANIAANNYFTVAVNKDVGYGYITIKKVNITATIGNYEKTYGNDNPTFSCTIPNFNSDEVGSLVAVSIEGQDEGKNVGEYALTATLKNENSFYNLSVEKGTFKVSPKDITVTATADIKKTYGDEDPKLTYAYNGLVDYADSVFSGTLGRTVGENVGTYVINQGTLSAGKNYTINFTSAAFEITQKEIFVTPNELSKVYGDSDPTLTYTYGQLANGDNASIFSGRLTRTAGETVGTYAINKGTLSAGNNYYITFTAGKVFTITTRQATVSIVSQEYALGTIPSPDNVLYTSTGLMSSDKLIIPNFGTLSKNGNDYYVASEFDFAEVSIDSGTLQTYTATNATQIAIGGSVYTIDNTEGDTPTLTLSMNETTYTATDATHIKVNGIDYIIGKTTEDTPRLTLRENRTTNYTFVLDPLARLAFVGVANQGIVASFGSNVAGTFTNIKTIQYGTAAPANVEKLGDPSGFDVLFTGDANQISEVTYTITYHQGQTQVTAPTNVGTYRALIRISDVFDEDGNKITANYSGITIISPSLVIAKVDDPEKNNATTGLQYNGLLNYAATTGISVQYGTTLSDITLSKTGYSITWKNTTQNLTMGGNTCTAIFESATGNYLSFEQELIVTLTKRVIDHSAGLTFSLAGTHQYTGSNFVDSVSVTDIVGNNYDLFNMLSICDIAYEYSKHSETNLNYTTYTNDYPNLPEKYKTRVNFTIKAEYRDFYTFEDGNDTIGVGKPSAVYEITKATLSLSVGTVNFVYDGEEKLPTFGLYFNGQNVTNNVVVNTVLKEDSNGTFTNAVSSIDAGRYQMTITVSNHALYEINRSIIFNINPKPIVITIAEPGYYEFVDGNTHINLESSTNEPSAPSTTEEYYQGITDSDFTYSNGNIYLSGELIASQTINGGEFIIFSIADGAKKGKYVYYGAFYKLEGAVGELGYTGAEKSGAYVCVAYVSGGNYSGYSIKPFVINKKVIKDLSLRTSMTIDQGEYYPTVSSDDGNYFQNCKDEINAFVNAFISQVMVNNNYQKYTGTLKFSTISENNFRIKLTYTGNVSTIEVVSPEGQNYMDDFMATLIGTGSGFHLITYTASADNCQDYDKTVKLYVNPTIVSFNVQTSNQVMPYNGQEQLRHIQMSWIDKQGAPQSYLFNETTKVKNEEGHYTKEYESVKVDYYTYFVGTTTFTAASTTQITIGATAYTIGADNGKLTLAAGTKYTASNSHVITIGTNTYLIGKTTDTIPLLTLTNITVTSPKKAGQNYAVVAVVDLSNSMKYQMIDRAEKVEFSYRFEIEEAQYTLSTISKTAYEYSGTAFNTGLIQINSTLGLVAYNLTGSNNGLNVGVQYFNRNGETIGDVSITPVNVGSYTARYSIKESETNEYVCVNPTERKNGYYYYDVNFEITQYQLKESDLVLGNVEFAYNGNKRETTARFNSPSDAKFNGKILSISYSGVGIEEGMPKGAGKYDFTISVISNSSVDRNIGAYAGKLTIAKKTISNSEIKATLSKEYTGEVQTVSAAELINSSIINANDFEITTTTEMKNPGDYAITVSATSAGNFTGSITTTFTITVKQLPADTTADNKPWIAFDYGSLNADNMVVDVVANGIWIYEAKVIAGTWAFVTTGNNVCYGISSDGKVISKEEITLANTLNTLSALNSINVQDGNYEIPGVFIPDDAGYAPTRTILYVRVNRADYPKQLTQDQATFIFPDMGDDDLDVVDNELIYRTMNMGNLSLTIDGDTLEPRQIITLSDSSLNDTPLLTYVSTYTQTEETMITIANVTYVIGRTEDDANKLTLSSAGTVYTATDDTTITVDDIEYTISTINGTSLIVLSATLEAELIETTDTYYMFKAINGGTLTPASLNHNTKTVDVYVKVIKPTHSVYLQHPFTIATLTNGETVSTTLQNQITKEMFFVNTTIMNGINFTMQSKKGDADWEDVEVIPTSIGLYAMKFTMSSDNNRIQEETLNFNLRISAGTITTQVEKARSENYMFTDELLPQITWTVSFEEQKGFENVYYKGATEVFKYAYNEGQEKWMWTTDNGNTWSDEQPTLTEGSYSVNIVDKNGIVGESEFTTRSYSFIIVDKSKIGVNNNIALAYGETFGEIDSNSTLNGATAFKYDGTAFSGTRINGATIDKLSTDVIFNNSAVKVEYVDYVKFTIGENPYYFYYSKEVATFTDGETETRFYRETQFAFGGITLSWTGGTLSSINPNFNIEVVGKVFTYQENQYIYSAEESILKTFVSNNAGETIPAIADKEGFYYSAGQNRLFEMTSDYAKVYTTTITNTTAYLYVDVIFVIGSVNIPITSVQVPVKLATEIQILNISETYSGENYTPEYKAYYKTIKYNEGLKTCIEDLVEFGEIAEVPVFTYLNNSIAVDSIIAAGNYQIKIDFSKNGYSDFSKTIDVRMNKAIATIIPKTSTFTYSDGSTINLGKLVAIVGIDGEEISEGITYSYKKDGGTILASSIVNVGSYSVTISVNNTNYIGETTMEIVVKKKDTQLIKPVTSSNTFTYTGNAFDIVVPKLYAAAGNIDVDLTYDIALSSIINAGTYTITATYAGTSNLNGCSVDFVVVVLPQEATISFTNVEHIYDGTAKAITVEEGYPSTPTVSYWQEGVEVQTPTDAGVYDVKVDFASGNYVFTKQQTMIIKKANTSIIWPLDNSYTYGQSTIGAALVYRNQTALNGENIVYEYNNTTQSLNDMISTIKNEQEVFPVGTYVIAARYLETDNHFGCEKTISLNIAKATATINIDSTSLHYTGSKVVPSVTVTGLGGEEITTGINISYAENTDSDLETVIPSPTAVGWYKIIVKVNSTNYQGEVEEMFQIQKRELTLQASALECNYTGYEQPISVSILEEDIVLNDSNIKVLYNNNVEAPINAGEYTITARIEHKSYSGEITVADNCKYTIKKAEVSFYILNRGLKQYGFNNGTIIDVFKEVEVLSSIQGAVAQVSYFKDGQPAVPAFAENLTQSNTTTTYTVNVTLADDDANANYILTAQSTATLYMITIPYSTLYVKYNGDGSNVKTIEGGAIDVYCNPNLDMFNNKSDFLSLFTFYYDDTAISTEGGSVTVAGDWVINSVENPIVVVSQTATGYSIWAKVGQYISDGNDAALQFNINIIKDYAKITLVKSGNAVNILLDGRDAGSAAGSDIITYSGKNGEIAGQPSEMGNYHVAVLVNNSNFEMTTIDWNYSSWTTQLQDVVYSMTLENNIYNGQAKEVTISKISTLGPSTDDIKAYLKYYVMNDGSWVELDSAPVSVGKYKAEIDATGLTGFRRYILTYIFQIVPKQETPTISIVGTKDYDGNTKVVSVSGATEEKYELVYFKWENDDWALTESQTNPIMAVGKYKVRAQSTDINYNILEEQIFVINKGRMPVTVNTSKVVYNGIQQGIVLTLTQGSEIADAFYKYYREDGTLVVDINGDATLPTNVGKYTVVVSFDENTYYDIIETFYIDKAGATILITNTSQKYIGTELSASISISQSAECTVSYSKDRTSWTTQKPIDAGNYFVKAEINETSNYQGVAISQFVITPLEVFASITASDVTFTGEPLGVDAKVSVASTTLTSGQYRVDYYSLADTTSALATIPTALGTYEARVVVTDTNYVLVSGGVARYTIIPRVADYSLTFTRNTLQYVFSGTFNGGAVSNIAATVYELNGTGEVEIISIAGSNYYKLENQEITKKGTYIIKLSAENYQNGYFLVDLPKDNYTGSVSTLQLEASYVESPSRDIFRQNANGEFALKKSEIAEYSVKSYIVTRNSNSYRYIEIWVANSCVGTALSSLTSGNYNVVVNGADGVDYRVVWSQDLPNNIRIISRSDVVITFETVELQYMLSDDTNNYLISAKGDQYCVYIDGECYSFDMDDVNIDANPPTVVLGDKQYSAVAAKASISGDIYDITETKTAYWESEVYNIDCTVTVDNGAVKENGTTISTINANTFKLGSYEYTYYPKTINETTIKALVVSSVSINGSVYSITWNGSQFSLNKISGDGGSITVDGSSFALNNGASFDNLSVGDYAGTVAINTADYNIYIDVTFTVY